MLILEIQPSYKRGDVILLRGEALFSKCPIPKAEIKFVWTQEAAQPSTALAIPAGRVLTTYAFAYADVC